MGSIVSPGIINEYTIKPKNLTQYTAYRGVTDFTQIGQFDQFETGYSFLSVISMPKYLEMLASYDKDIERLVNGFKHTLEYEFRGLSGLPDIETGTSTITDGINEAQMINKVSMDTSIQVSMNYFEKSGSPITKFCEYYLTGIKDRMSQAKTYHGLIKNGKMEPSLENEVFTLLYYVTDNTCLRLERAVLLANAQITNVPLSTLYNSERGNISNQELTITFNAFPIMGRQVDKAASALLEDITGVDVAYTNSDPYTPVFTNNTNDEGDAYIGGNYGHLANTNGPAALDSNNYNYGIIKNDSTLNGNNLNTYNAEKTLNDAQQRATDKRIKLNQG